MSYKESARSGTWTGCSNIHARSSPIPTSKREAGKTSPKKEPLGNGYAEPDYRSLVQAAGDVIYALDLQGHVTFMNPAGVRVLGYSQQQVLGRHFFDFLTPASCELAQKHFSQGLHGTETTPFFEVEARHKSGRIVHLEIRAGGLYVSGAMIGRQGIARDITELKFLQTQVAEKSERVTLLEERTRIAMKLYAHIASLAQEQAGDPDVLHRVDEMMQRASAEKMKLSTADLRILDLLAHGKSNREIADVVSRSPNTVKDHVAKIMQRLGVKRRAEVAVRAMKLGLIGDAGRADHDASDRMS